MKRKLFFMLPNMETAHSMMDQMLLARIEERNIRFLAKPEMPLEGLPEANVMEKTDSLHGIGVGAAIGGVSGALGGLLVVAMPALFSVPSGSGQQLQAMAILAIGLAGAAFGAWWTGFAASMVSNSSLAPYKDQIARGEVLMIVTVPYHRISDIRALVGAKCGDACNYVRVTPMDHVIFP
ncbi:MAG: hypothetical protein WAW75_07730 [Gallionella sp.]